jgi:hypothetical protein
VRTSNRCPRARRCRRTGSSDSQRRRARDPRGAAAGVSEAVPRDEITSAPSTSARAGHVHPASRRTEAGRVSWSLGRGLPEFVTEQPGDPERRQARLPAPQLPEWEKNGHARRERRARLSRDHAAARHAGEHRARGGSARRAARRGRTDGEAEAHRHLRPPRALVRVIDETSAAAAGARAVERDEGCTALDGELALLEAERRDGEGLRAGRRSAARRRHRRAVADRTMRELADLHIAAFVESWAPATLRNFRHRWDALRAFVGRNTSARLVTEETLDEFRAKMRAAGVVTNQRTETVKAVKQCFRWARRRKLIAENPIADYTIKLAKTERVVEVPEWSPDDTAASARSCSPSAPRARARHWRLEVGFFLAASQGPRVNALLHLAWDDVNLSGERSGTRAAPASCCRREPSGGIPRSTRPRASACSRSRAAPCARCASRASGARGSRTTGRGCSRRRAPSRRKGESWGYQAANRALRELCDRCAPAVEWVKGRAFHGFRKYSAGEIHRLTGSERAAADWIGDKDVKVVRKHYLKKRAEEQRGVAQQIDVDASARPTSRPLSSLRSAPRSRAGSRSRTARAPATVSHPSPSMPSASTGSRRWGASRTAIRGASASSTPAACSPRT